MLNPQQREKYKTKGVTDCLQAAGEHVSLTVRQLTHSVLGLFFKSPLVVRVLSECSGWAGVHGLIMFYMVLDVGWA